MKKNLKQLSTREITTIVKTNKGIVEWGIWSVFNDKRKDGRRRLKFMRNGWVVPDHLKKDIVDQLKQSFVNTNVETIEFKVGMSFRGRYDYLSIVKKD